MLQNLICQTANAPGAGTISFSGVEPGRLAFSAKFATGKSVFYFLSDGTQSEWGTGTLTTGSPDTLSRDTILGNSANTTSKLNFAGTCTILNEIPAERALYLDNSGNLAASPNAVNVGSGSNGLVRLLAGDSTHPGTIEFWAAGGRVGFIGWTDGGSHLLMSTDGGYGGWRLTGDILAGGAGTIIPNPHGFTVNNSDGSTRFGVGSTSSPLQQYYYNGNLIGGVTTNGSSTSYNTTSDYRLKTTYGPANADWLLSVPTYDGTYNSDLTATHRPLILAHELQAHASWAVYGEKDAVDAGGNMVAQQVDYQSLIPALVALAQSQDARIKALEARLAGS